MIQLDVSIMGQSYKLACKEGEETALQQAVAYLDGKMCAIRDAGCTGNCCRIIGHEIGIGAVGRYDNGRSETENCSDACRARFGVDPAGKSILISIKVFDSEADRSKLKFPAVFAIAIYSLNHLCASVAEFCLTGVSIASPMNPKLN